MTRCSWCGTDPVYVAYHDNEWGRPVTDSEQLFAKLCLDGQQAGLSWITILKRVDGYMRAYHGLRPEKVAQFDQQDTQRLMQDKGVIRNRQKIKSVIENARAYQALTNQGVLFSEKLWSFVGGAPQHTGLKTQGDMPVSSAESEAMSAYLKSAGFSFVGPVICYAFMQAVGMYNDHITCCPHYEECLNIPWSGSFS